MSRTYMRPAPCTYMRPAPCTYMRGGLRVFHISGAAVRPGHCCRRARGGPCRGEGRGCVMPSLFARHVDSACPAMAWLLRPPSGAYHDAGAAPPCVPVLQATHRVLSGIIPSSDHTRELFMSIASIRSCTPIRTPAQHQPSDIAVVVVGTNASPAG